MNDDIKKAQELVNTLQISDYFTFMRSKVGENPMLARLEQAFILNKTDIDFHEQLKSLANVLLKSVLERSKTAEADLQILISDTLDDFAKEQLAQLSKRLKQLQELTMRYAEALDFETDPKRQMHLEKDSALTQSNLEKVLAEIEMLKKKV